MVGTVKVANALYNDIVQRPIVRRRLRESPYRQRRLLVLSNAVSPVCGWCERQRTDTAEL
jgi:hypothetical protein